MDQHMRKHKSRGHLRGLDGSVTPEEVIVDKKYREGDGIKADAVQEGDSDETNYPDAQVDIVELLPYSFCNYKFSVLQQGRDEAKTHNEMVRGTVSMVRLIP